MTRTLFSPAVPSTGSPPARSTISGIQWPGANGGSVHSSSTTRGRGRVPTRRTTSARRRCVSCTQGVGLDLAAGGPAEHPDRLQHLGERVRVDGQHLGGAAEVGQRVVDDRDVDGADRAQVLGDDQVGVQARPGRPRRGGRGRRRAASPRPRSRRSREGSAPPASRWSTRSCGSRASGGVVALEGHADDVVTRPDREEDLGGRGEQGDDAHALQPRVTAWSRRPRPCCS